MTAALTHLPRVVRVVVPVHVTSGDNSREHRMARARRVSKARDAVRWALVGQAPLPLPVRVTMRRLSSGVMDLDGLLSACKPVRDEVAVWLGLPVAKRKGRAVADDRDGRGVVWAYEQGPARRQTVIRKGRKVSVAIHEVEITVEPWGAGHEAAEAAGVA